LQLSKSNVELYEINWTKILLKLEGSSK